MKTFTFKLLLLIIVLVMSSGDIIAQVNWTKYPGNPVLPAGLNGEWDRHKFTQSILYNADSSRYESWFTASVGPSVGWRPYRIGFAASEDGINWTTYPDPVLIPGVGGEWDSNTVEAPSVIRENGQYKMWYTTFNEPGTSKIGYATSPDGVNWTKYNDNPIFEAGTQPWEAGGVYFGCVMPLGGGYKMWYGGFTVGFTSEAIGYATSTDGILWQRDTLNNPVLPPSPSGWDDTGVYAPNVLLIDNFYYMWYSGWGTIDQIGLATSYDGVNWIKHDSNPVLKPSPGQWDHYVVNGGSVMFIDDTLYMWYGSQGGSGYNYLWQIGLATSPFVPVAVYDYSTPPTEFALEQNYPNPFNPSTKIKYSVPQASQVTIKVFDVLGNEIETLINEEKPVGSYEVDFNSHSGEVRNLPSGVYFYQLKVGDFISTKKMLLLK
ncbi:MAG: T9SS type A sorting domain-containing protein [Ignavibacteriaceae bacterium]